MKFLIGLIVSLLLILSGIFLLVLYIVLRTKAHSWLTAIAIFSIFGLGVGLIALGVRGIMLLFRKPIDGKNKD